MFRFVTKTILILSLVSLFADIASEMLYPIMPLYMQQIGFGALLIGIWEGIAQFISGLGKVWMGSLSDQLDRRNIFIRSGYMLSAIGKPVMGMFPSIAGLFTGRVLDRTGKGLRGSARDALLIQESAPEDRGKVFGFHRGMDTLGAVIGPLITLLLLQAFPGQYQWLFLLAFLPGIISVLITLFLPKEAPQLPKAHKVQPFRGIFRFWREASPAYKRLLAGGLLFALLNSSDLFLILLGKESGTPDVHLVGAYILYNIVYALLALPLGQLADKIGFKPVFLAAVCVYGGIYWGLSQQPGLLGTYVLFGIYGIFAAAHEGIVKAWLSQFIPSDKKATGMGLYQFLGTVCKLVASPLIGLIWIFWDGPTAFWVVSLCVFAVFFVLILLLPNRAKSGFQ